MLPHVQYCLWCTRVHVLILYCARIVLKRLHTHKSQHVYMCYSAVHLFFGWFLSFFEMHCFINGLPTDDHDQKERLCVGRCLKASAQEVVVLRNTGETNRCVRRRALPFRSTAVCVHVHSCRSSLSLPLRVFPHRETLHRQVKKTCSAE